MRPFFAVISLALLTALVFAAAPPTLSQAELKLIEELGEETTRQAAAKKLANMGMLILPALRHAAKEHVDVDVRLNALVVITAIETKLYAEVRRYVGSEEGLGCVAVSPDGKRMVSGCWGSVDKLARVWDVESGKELMALKGHIGGVVCAAWSPNGKQVLTGSRDRFVRLWDADKGESLLTIANAHSGWLHAVLFTPDGKLAVTCGNDNAIVVWDLATGKVVRRIGEHTAMVRGLAWMPDGKRLASTGFDGAVRVTDFATGKEVASMGTGHRPHQAWFIAVSPDGKRIASTGNDKMVRLWDVATSKQLKEFAGHTEGVHGIAYSRCGKRLLTCGFNTDKSVRVWDIEGGKEIQSIELPQMASGVAFSADDGHAIMACNDKTLRLWKIRR